MWGCGRTHSAISRIPRYRTVGTIRQKRAVWSNSALPSRYKGEVGAITSDDDMDDSPIFRRIICANIVPDLADRGTLHPQIQHEWSVDREARKSYLTATRDVGDGPFFMTIMHVALTCFFF